MKRGPLFESRLAAYFTAALGHPVERRVMGGIKDKGDLTGISNWTIEAKNLTKNLTLGQAMNEARKEAVNARCRYFAAVLNRRSHGLERSYAVLELWELAELIADQMELAALRGAVSPER
jgi:hypothetical protein